MKYGFRKSYWQIDYIQKFSRLKENLEELIKQFSKSYIPKNFQSMVIYQVVYFFLIYLYLLVIEYF